MRCTAHRDPLQSQEAATVGEPFQVTTVVPSGAHEASWYTAGDDSPFRLIAQRVDPRDGMDQLESTWVAVRPGTHEWGVRVDWLDAEGQAKSITLPARDMTLISSDSGQPLAGLSGDPGAAWGASSAITLLISLGLGALLGAKFRRSRQARNPSWSRQPAAWALRRLRPLAKQPDPQELGRTLRLYLDSAYQLSSCSLSTPELVEVLLHEPRLQPASEPLTPLLQRLDRQQFGGSSNSQAWAQSMQLVENFVRQTDPARGPA